MESRTESAFEFVVASGDPAELLELIEKAFDAVALAIERWIVVQLPTAGVDGRNDRFNAIKSQTLADTVGIVAFIEGGGLEHVVGVETFVERFKLAAIMRLSRSQVQRDTAVFVHGGRVDLRGQAPTRAAQSLVGAVFFGAPAACWWARTVVESMNNARASAKVALCKCCHNRRQTPRFSQRRKRM